MNTAENWRAPDWFTSRVESEPDVRIVIVDGTSEDEQQLLRVVDAAGIDCPWDHWGQQSGGSAALLFEQRNALSAAVRCLRALRAHDHFATLPALCSVSADQLTQLEGASGFDDFVLHPCAPLEVRARVRAIEQRRRALLPPEMTADPAPDGDGIQLDAVSHEALVGGSVVRLTAREFALLAYLRARRGRVLSRQQLLASVWGHRYRGGPRTVDTHIGRLRLKFGAALTIETVRSNGYRLRE